MRDSQLQLTMQAPEVYRLTRGGNGKLGVLSVPEDWQRNIRRCHLPHPESSGLTLKGG